MSTSLGSRQPPPTSAPESKAVAFLKDPARWRDNPLLAGEAARALALAAHRGHQVGDALQAIAPTLNDPDKWSTLTLATEVDRPLARVVMASALAALGERDNAPSQALRDAALQLVAEQQRDGTWLTGKESPAWSAPAATARARATLIAAGYQPDDFTVAQTDRWSRTAEVSTVADAAAVLLAIGVTSDVMADRQRALCLSIIRRAQHEAGGWSAAADGSPDVAVSALALTALQQYEIDPRLARSTYQAEELRAAVSRGRAFLAAAQKPDGSWSDVATTSWVLVALLSR